MRQRPREFWFRLFETVNATEMCAPITTATCKREDHRPVKVKAVSFTRTRCARRRFFVPRNKWHYAELFRRDDSRLLNFCLRSVPQEPMTPAKAFCKSGPFHCSKSCNALEHIWAHVLCQPCHNKPKGDDPRYPWTVEAKKQEDHARGGKAHRRLASEIARRRKDRKRRERAERIERHRL